MSLTQVIFFSVAISISPSMSKSTEQVILPVIATVLSASVSWPVIVKIVSPYVPFVAWSDAKVNTPLTDLNWNPSPASSPLSLINVKWASPLVALVDLIVRSALAVCVKIDVGALNVDDVSQLTTNVSSASIVMPVAVPEIYWLSLTQVIFF